MARDPAPYIQVNAVCPGAALTPLARLTLTPEEREAAAADIPLEQWAVPEDQAEGVYYLVQSRLKRLHQSERAEYPFFLNGNASPEVLVTEGFWYLFTHL